MRTCFALKAVAAGALTAAATLNLTWDLSSASSSVPVAFLQHDASRASAFMFICPSYLIKPTSSVGVPSSSSVSSGLFGLLRVTMLL